MLVVIAIALAALADQPLAGVEDHVRAVDGADEGAGGVLDAVAADRLIGDHAVDDVDAVDRAHVLTTLKTTSSCSGCTSR